MYESDLTKFMRRYLEEHPEEVESQKRGRAIWWDKGPGSRNAPPPAQHTPHSGGAEHTFARVQDEKS
ncbi:MAG TPA: DUF3460 family protein [Burkholderiales bacterium]|nr:DUF3460 family protein [Burkholderiales bacterium]